MRKKKPKINRIYHKLTFWLGVLVVGAALGSVIQFTRAWVEPTANAPGGDIAAPLNTGWAPQTKVGDPVNHGGVAADICVDPNGDGNKKCLSNGGSGGGGIYQAVHQGGCPSCEPGYRAVKCEQIGQFNIGSYYIYYYATLCSYLGADSCSAAGGTIMQDGATSFCQFNGSSCHAGWSKYKNWSETSANTCSGSHVDSCTGRTSCATGSHAWANTAAETCGYKNETTGQTWNPQYYCTQDGGCEGGCSFGYCSSTDVSSCYSGCDETGCYTYCNPSCSLDSSNSYGCGSYSPYCSTANATCTANVSKVGCY